MALLVDETLDRLMEIVLARGAGGRMPSQDALSIEFGVSRTVLREAVSKLEFLGVLTSRPKIGTLISNPSKWQIVNADVIQWRLRAGESRASLSAEIAGVEID